MTAWQILTLFRAIQILKADTTLQHDESRKVCMLSLSIDSFVSNMNNPDLRSHISQMLSLNLGRLVSKALGFHSRGLLGGGGGTGGEAPGLLCVKECQ